MVLPQPGQLGFGMPPHREQAVDHAREIRDIRNDLSNIWAAVAAGTPTIVMPFQYTNNLTFPNDNTYHLYATTGAFAPPANCSRLIYFVTCSAGTTWSGGAGTTGGFDVQVAAAENGTWSFAPGAANGWLTNYGSEQSTFVGSAIVSPGTTIQFGVNVAAAQTSSSGAGWAQVTGVMIWTKN